MSTLGAVRAALARLAHLQPPDVDPLRTFLPALHHGRALHRNIVVVLGGRGSGKTALFRLVNDPRTRAKARALFDTDLIPEADWFNAFSTGSTAHPDVGVLAAQASAVSDMGLRAFWMTHLLRRLRESSPEMVDRTEDVADILSAPVADVAAWLPMAEARIGAVSAALDSAERSLERAGRTVVATYDNLDLIAPFVPGARRRAIATLLALWLTLDERYLRLRGKVFLRDDLLDAAELGFADASKLRSRAERLEWASGDLYRIIVRHLVNGPGGETVRSWLEGTQGMSLSDRGELGWMVGPLAEPAQRAFAARLAGRTIGRGVVKGSTHEWMFSRLRDARQTTTPRAMLSLVGFAAEEAERRGRSAARGPVFGGSELLVALKQTSRDRVEEVKEESPAAVRLEGFRGVSVPLSREEAVQRLSVRRPGEPANVPEDGTQILDELLRVGILRVLEDGRVDVPDIFRYAFDIGPDYVTAWREFIEGRERGAIDQFLREAPMLREILRKVDEDTKLIERDLERRDWGAAKTKLEQQLKLWEAADDPENQFDTHFMLSMAVLRDNNMDAAQAHMETALQIARRNRDPKREATAWLMLAWVLAVTGRGVEADEALRSAANLIDRKTLVDVRAAFFSSVAFMSVLWGERPRAAELARTALHEIRRAGDDERVVPFYLTTGLFLMQRHDMNGLILIFLAKAAPHKDGSAGNEALAEFKKGFEAGSGMKLDGPMLDRFRRHAEAAWHKDGGESLLVEILTSEPNSIADRLKADVATAGGAGGLSLPGT
jgi:tetratricopeptide (TPR) repeat protein